VAWQIIGSIRDVETIATGAGLRARRRLRKRYGAGRWRKCKGVATIRLPDGTARRAEVHWYEASGFGRFEIKLKRLLPDDR
jgi:hypothetical protein